MKSLNNYISENIYGNLNVGVDDLVKEWVEKYNKQKYVSMLRVGDDGKVWRDSASSRLFPVADLMIYSNDILEDGHIPDYIKFHTTGNHLNVYIRNAPEFKSFKNFPKVNDMYLEISVPIKDFHTLDNCEYVSLSCAHNNIILHNLKPKIIALTDSMNAYSGFDISKVLRNTKGCTFSNYTGSIDSVGKNTTLVSIKDCEFKKPDALNEFFKNNTFTSNVTFISKVHLDNLSFFDEAKCKFNDITLYVGELRDRTDDELMDYFEPLFDNEDKIICNNIYVLGSGPGPNGDEILTRLNQLRPGSRLKFDFKSMRTY